MESVLVFTFNKETKNFWKYVQEDGVSTIYLHKAPDGSAPPKVIKAIIEVEVTFT